MSQTYTELSGSDALTTSRTTLNNNFDALKTGFSGTAVPFTASATTEGATYYNKTDKKNYQVIKSGNNYVWAAQPDVVHTYGDEAIGGAKTFTSDITAPNITTLTSDVSTLKSSAAHLAQTETFTGDKTFSGNVDLGSKATATTKTVATNTTAVATTAYVKLAVPVSIGSSTKPVYTDASGVITASNATVGSSSQPVYMNNGTITAITGAIANDISGNAATATKATKDGDGNVITSKYVTVDSENTITGNKTHTGSLKAPTVDASTNSTDVATTAFVKAVLAALYPVGSIYIGTQSTCPLSTLISGSTWTLVATDKALWGGNGSNGNTTINAGLPNITGKSGYTTDREGQESGAYYTQSGNTGWLTWDTHGSYTALLFDASKSNSIYGASNTVQPPAYRVNVWRRTA